MGQYAQERLQPPLNLKEISQLNNTLCHQRLVPAFRDMDDDNHFALANQYIMQ
jgi:hypothetical protein